MISDLLMPVWKQFFERIEYAVLRSLTIKIFVELHSTAHSILSKILLPNSHQKSLIISPIHVFQNQKYE
jgi:hypothetical protein